MTSGLEEKNSAVSVCAGVRAVEVAEPNA